MRQNDEHIGPLVASLTTWFGRHPQLDVQCRDRCGQERARLQVSPAHWDVLAGFVPSVTAAVSAQLAGGCSCCSWVSLLPVRSEGCVFSGRLPCARGRSQALVVLLTHLQPDPADLVMTGGGHVWSARDELRRAGPARGGAAEAAHLQRRRSNAVIPDPRRPPGAVVAAGPVVAGYFDIGYHHGGE